VDCIDSRPRGLLSRSLPAKLELAPTFVEGLAQVVLMLRLSVVLVACAGLQVGAQQAASEASPAEQLRALKAEGDFALRDFNRTHLPGTAEAVRKRGAELYRTREADLVRRALALAKDHPEAPAALNWAFGERLGSYFNHPPAECDAICAAVTG